MFVWSLEDFAKWSILLHQHLGFLLTAFLPINFFLEVLERFLGFDTYEPTSKSGGNATAVQQIRKANGYRSLVMIGDGATDLEACKPGGADLFICYAGVQLRGAVANKANWLVFNFKDSIDSLE